MIADAEKERIDGVVARVRMEHAVENPTTDHEKLMEMHRETQYLLHQIQGRVSLLVVGVGVLVAVALVRAFS